jgi:two-component system sensor histidine kinase/response regulator
MTAGSINALLIEDNPGDARLVREALSQTAGIELEWVDRLSTGMARLERSGIDVVLLDLSLPDSKGFSTIEHLSQTARLTPIVALSGLGDSAEVQDAIKFGAEDYLVKGSFSPDLLARSIRYAIDRRRARDELARARDAALESARVRSEFLANMSHEIRTPLNGIVGVMRLLIDTGLSNDQREMVDIARHSADALLAIVNDILDFSKISAGKVSLEEADFDLGSVVESVIALFAEQALRKGVELASYVETDVPVLLRGDATRLCQVLTNLVSNAVKFTPLGAVTVRASLASDEDDELTLRFTVKDTGIGIPLESQRYLFQAFAQADGSTTRKFGGTGLGLAICAQLVELMGGNIGVQSEAGGGATFWFTTKLRKQHSAESIPLAAPRRLAGVRMLVVDQSRTAAELVQRHALDWHMRCDIVLSATEALLALKRAAARGRPYEIAMIEVQQPPNDGLTLSRAITGDRALSKTRLLGVYSLGARPNDKQMRQAGIRALLLKPIKQSQLFNTLNVTTASIEEATVNQNNGTAHATPEIRSSIPAEVREHIRILMVEDNVVNQQVQVRMLQRIGLHADCCSNGRQALTAIAKKTYEIVLMDCQMPEMDGYAATRAIRRRESPEHRAIIIGVTAHALSGDREECLAVGMDDYISKPVVPEVLAATLEKWILRLDRDTSASRFQHDALILDHQVLSGLRDGESPDEADFGNRLVTTFLADCDKRLQAIRIALDRGDLKAIHNAAHSLKGAAAQIGAQRVMSAAAQLEAQTQEPGAMKDLAFALGQLETEVTALRAHFETESQSGPRP